MQRLLVLIHHRSMARVLKVFHSNYVHTHTFIRNRNEPYLPLLSQPQLALIYRTRRDGRPSRPPRRCQVHRAVNNVSDGTEGVNHCVLQLQVSVDGVAGKESRISGSRRSSARSGDAISRRSRYSTATARHYYETVVTDTPYTRRRRKRNIDKISEFLVFISSSFMVMDR